MANRLENGAKLKYMPFYGEDFFGDDKVLVMDYAQKGIYFELLWRQWVNGTVPGDVELLRSMIKPGPGESKAWKGICANIDNLFPLVDGDPYSRQNVKLERVRAKSLEVVEAKIRGGKESAKARARAKELKESNRTPGTDLQESFNTKGEGKGVSPPNHTQPNDTTHAVADDFNEEREYLLGCVMAANAGMRGNPNLKGERPMILGQQFDRVEWRRDGIPLDLAQEIISEVARSYRPKNGPTDYLTSLKYFDRPLREEWERQQMQEHQVVTRDEVNEIRKELDL